MEFINNGELNAKESLNDGKVDSNVLDATTQLSKNNELAQQGKPEAEKSVVGNSKIGNAGILANKIYRDSGYGKNYIGIYPHGRSLISDSTSNISVRFADIASFAPDTIAEDSDPLFNTPLIPDDIFQTLPLFLRESCQSFDNKRERDVYLTSALSILSGCFSTVSGEYSQQTHYPNLYCFIVAPPASGKGVMAFAKQLGSAIHDKLLQESKDKKKQYEIDFRAYESAKKGAKKGGAVLPITPPIAPPFKVLFIPGDISSIKFIDHLAANGGTGILCETEADTLGGSLKQDWGGFSDKLRKAFQHEPISYSRKGDSAAFEEVNYPRVSVVITGTPSQVTGIIKNVADGLFSRFMYYTYKAKPEWKSAFPKGKVNLTNYFNSLAVKVAGYSEALNKTETKFSLTEEQQGILNKVCSKWLSECGILIGDEASATVIRLGIILYRIAMVLSILKKAESGDTRPDLICSNTDFNTALALAQVYKEHSFIMLKQLPKQGDKKSMIRTKFFDALPTGKPFKRSEAVEVGKQLVIKERTVDKYLADFLKGQLLEYVDGKPGIYKKVDLQTMLTMQS